MAGRADIEAGRAFVRLFLKNDLTSALTKTLSRTGRQMQGVGKMATLAGAGVAAAGVGLLSPIVASVKQFASFGDTLDKMSQRTGVAAPALAELGFAAEQSGTGIDKVEAGIRKMQKTIGDANRGLSTAVDGLELVGESAASLEGLAPEEQFQRLADGVAAIEDPTKRAAAAMEIFGRGGTALLPMLGSLKELRQEANDLGIVPTEKAVKDAAKVTDAINRIKRSVGGVAFEIGASLADSVLALSANIQKISKTVGTWIRENMGLVKTIAAVAIGLVAAGAAITTIGVALIGTGLALSGLATTIGAMVGALGMLFSPLGVVAGLLIGGTVLWARYTSSGKGAIKGLTSILSKFAAIGKEAIGGIGDALASGNLALAGQIAIAGLQTVLSAGLTSLVSIIGGRFGEFIRGLGGDLISGDLSGAWSRVIDSMAATWATFSQFVHNAFGLSISGIVDGAMSVVGTIKTIFGTVAEFASLLTVSWDQTWRIFAAGANVAILQARDALAFVFMEWLPGVIGGVAEGLSAAFGVAMQNWRTIGGAFVDLFITRITAIPNFLIESFSVVFDAIRTRFESMVKSLRLAMSGKFAEAAKAFAKGNLDATKELVSGIKQQAIDFGQQQMDATVNFTTDAGPAALAAASAFADAFQANIGDIDTTVSADVQAAKAALAVEIENAAAARDAAKVEGGTDTKTEKTETIDFRERFNELVTEARTAREAATTDKSETGKQGPQFAEQKPAATSAVAVTFSAAAAQASGQLGTGGTASDPAERSRQKQLKAIEAQSTAVKMTTAETKKLRETMEKFVIGMAVR